MALSNWLTRDEWNTVYFAGLGAAINGAKCENLGDQMHLGIGELVKAGYKFQGIIADENGNYEKVTQCCNGNETVLAEMIGGYGGFDKLGRAKEAIEFSKNIPALDFTWLSEAITAANTASSGQEPAGVSESQSG